MVEKIWQLTVRPSFGSEKVIRTYTNSSLAGADEELINLVAEAAGVSLYPELNEVPVFNGEVSTLKVSMTDDLNRNLGL